MTWRRWYHRLHDAWRSAVSGWRYGPDAETAVYVQQHDELRWRVNITVNVPGELGPVLVSSDSFSLPPGGGGWLWVAQSAERGGIRGALTRVSVNGRPL